MLKIQIAARIKCKRHPGFDPRGKKGEAAIKGNCAGCQELLALRDFGNKSKELLIERIEANELLAGKVK